MNANQPIEAGAGTKPRGHEARRPAPTEGGGRGPRRPAARRRGPLPLPDGRVAEVMSGVAGRIGNQPVTSLAVAAALGFVVGGALSFRAGRVLLSLAARQLGREVIKQLL